MLASDELALGKIESFLKSVPSKFTRKIYGQRYFLVLSLLMLLFYLPTIKFNQIEANSPAGYPVHNLNTGLNYTGIQEAINAPETLNGHAIFAEAGTYYENVVLNKSLTLIGENKNTTTIYGNETSTVVYVMTSNTTVQGFTFQNGYVGVRIWNCSDVTIEGNDISFNRIGLLMDWNCYDNRILNNTIHDNGFPNHWQSAGLYITGSGGADRPHNTIISNNVIYGNNIGFWMEQCINTTMRNNRVDASRNYTFGLLGKFEDDFYHDIDTSNTIDGKPIYYIVNRNGSEISGLGEVGFLGIINCTDVTVHDIDLSSNSYVAMQIAHLRNSTIANITIQNSFYSMFVEFSSGNLFTGINVSNNFRGICISNSSSNVFLRNAIISNEELAFSFYQSSNNTFLGNRIGDNHYALTFYRSTYNEICENNITGHQFGDSYAVSFCEGSYYNLFYHNNFVNNSQQIINYIMLPNYWNNTLEGNYWSEYSGFDQDYDGIGDTKYSIDTYNVDNFPLMGMFSSFDTSSGWKVNIISNSTINSFHYSESNETIRILVFGEFGYGFCRISIPHALMNVSSISVIIDNGSIPVLCSNYTLYDNVTHRWVYFSYPHSTHEIVIVPEFPSFLILPLFIIAALLLVIVRRRRCIYV